MHQKDILKHLTILIDNGYNITNVNWETGEISGIPSKIPANGLSDSELAACKVGLVNGIKMVRNNRGLGLAEAKAFVEKHFNFVTNE